MIVSMRGKNGIKNSFINLDNIREINVSQISGERERIIEVFYLHHDMAIYQEQNYDIEDFLDVMEEIVANSYATRSYP